ncbi:MAG: SLBB domain-containing protein, partial [Balneolales bacterium]
MYNSNTAQRLFQLISPAILIVLFSLASQESYSQSSGGEERRSQSFINVEGLLGNNEPFYFIDNTSVEMARNQFAQEGYIDEDSYTLGTGDIFSIEYTGGLNGTMRGLRVNPQGDVILPNIGSVRVKDSTMISASRIISQKVGEMYQNTEVSLSLDKARAITIHLTGDVPFPGKREVNALTRADQAVYTAFFEHDPRAMQTVSTPYRYSSDFLNAKRYTLRNISINRENGEDQNVDLLAYFKGGDKTANPMVSDGDVITIRRMREYTPTITISGAVKSADELEYRPEDTLGDLVTIANGYTHDADKGIINIFRMEGREIKKIAVDTGQENINNFNLQPNDRIVVPFDRSLQNNRSAWVYGEAANPGNYPIIDGETTALDLLEMADGTSGKALAHAAYLIRADASSTDISGASQFDPNLLKRTSDQLTQGMQYLELEAELNRNQIYLDASNREQLAKIVVYDGDQFHIPQDDKTVYLMGQVRSPGFYPFDQNMSVDQYISRAGDFALAAQESRIFVIK